MKMNQFPFIKEDDSLSFVRLSTLASDDCAQIFLAYNYPDLIIVLMILECSKQRMQFFKVARLRSMILFKVLAHIGLLKRTG